MKEQQKGENLGRNTDYRVIRVPIEKPQHPPIVRIPEVQKKHIKRDGKD